MKYVKKHSEGCAPSKKGLRRLWSFEEGTDCMLLFSPCCRAHKTHAYIPDVRKYHVSSVLFYPKAPFHVPDYDLGQVLAGLWERAGGIKRPPSANVTTFDILHTNQELLHELQKACGYGFVSKKPIKPRKMYTFTVSKRTDIVKVLELLHGSIRHEPKRLSVERVMAQIKASSPKTLFISPPQKSVVKTIAHPGWLIGYNSLGGKTYVDHALPLELFSHVHVEINDTSKKILMDVQNRIDALTVQEFAHYLAGLIDSDGHIEKNGAVQISFHLHDVALAYAIQRRIGHGVVDLVKSTRTAVYRSRQQGMVYIAWLVKGRLHHPGYIAQLKSQLLTRKNVDSQMARYGTSPPVLPPFESYWFAEGDACFAMKIHYGTVRGLFEVSQVEPILLDMIQSHFGRGSRHNKVRKQGFASGSPIGVWQSSNLEVTLACIAYFDRFSCMGQKYTQYLFWRPAVKIRESKCHFSFAGKMVLYGLKSILSSIRKNGLMYIFS